MKKIAKHRHKYVVGIDEAGRGPLAGPITFAALALKENSKCQIPNYQKIKDSKKLSAEKREAIYKELKKLKKEGKLNFSISHIKHTLIDKDGLSKCIKKGIKRCLDKITNNLQAATNNARFHYPTANLSRLGGADQLPATFRILLDGSLRAPDKYKNQKTIIRGDEKVKIIALASILAKVCRDHRMQKLAKKYPQYGFEIHKGYGTKAHYKALKKYGSCEIHRVSFLKKLI